MARKTYTSTAVKTRWNNKHYDRVTVMLPKGFRERLADWVKQNGTTTNAYMNSVIREALGVKPEDWKPIIKED